MSEKNEDFQPESLMMSAGFDPSTARNSIKNPIYQTSTFIFNTAEEGKAFFEKVYGDGNLEEKNSSLIYTRLNHPNLITAEKRLALLDGADDAAFFESGMAAITTTLLEFCQAGDLVAISHPLYGGTDAFVKNVLPRYDIQYVTLKPEMDKKVALRAIQSHPRAKKLAMIYLETPANPTNSLMDIEMMGEVASECSTAEKKALVAVDNTYMGPLWQKPLKHGADLVLYSATKYIGGHSDLIAGACSGKGDLIYRLKGMRSKLGCMASPWTSWLVSRSFETISLRMEKQAQNAAALAEMLNSHPKVEHVYYVGLLKAGDSYYELYKRQYTSGGAMLAFDVKGGEAEAFRFLNALQLACLAVSLGSTETLASHPFTMSSSNMSLQDRESVGITPAMIRISAGIENTEDLLSDFKQALGFI